MVTSSTGRPGGQPRVSPRHAAYFPSFVAAMFLAGCLPTGPSDAERVVFMLDFEQPYRVPLGGDVTPPITIAVKDKGLKNPTYRLEATGIVRVDETGRGLHGLQRGTTSVRVIYPTATGAPDTVFQVQVVVSAVSIDPSQDTLTRLQDSVRLSANALDANESVVPNTTFRWFSHDTSVAKVSQTGVVTAVDEGTASITAEADSVEGRASVTVVQVASAVSLSPEADTLRTVGRSTRFAALAFDSTGHAITPAKPHWSSSDIGVAVVDATGLVTATGAGTTRIVARVGNAADTATLVVAQVVRFVFLSPPFDTLTAIDDTARLRAGALDSLQNAIPNPLVTWASSDATIATVDQTGLLRALRNGAVVITGSSGRISTFATVVVRQEAVATRFSLDSVTLTKGDTLRLSGAGFDRNGYPVSDAAFNWRSDFGCVATVDAVGLVTARGGGRAYVVAAPANGGSSDTVVVRVTGAPDHGVIAFASRRGIEAICDDGSGRELLIPFAQYENLGPLMGDPSWSADGATIAFSRLEETGQARWYEDVPMTCRVYTARADGSELRPLLLYPSQCNRHPAWSPDGQEIAFVWGLPCFLCAETWSISIVNADGSNLRELLPHKAGVAYGYPTWSPDRKKLAFQGPSDSGSVIMVINADGSGLANLTTHRTARHYDQHPAWSPDGSQLAFVRDWGDIWVMNADGSGARNLTSSPAYDFHPAWSPDGSRIVFASGLSCSVDDWEGGEGGDCDLYVMNRDGTGLRQLTATNDWEIHPSWRRAAPPQTPSNARRRHPDSAR